MVVESDELQGVTILTVLDRRSIEEEINSFLNWMLNIEGTDVHFVALFSENPDAVPLLLSHGWPGQYCPATVPVVTLPA